MGGSWLARKKKFQGGPFAGKTQSEAQQAASAAWQSMSPEERAKFTGSRPMVSDVTIALTQPTPSTPTPSPARPPQGRYATPANALQSLGVAPPPTPAVPSATPANKPMLPRTGAPTQAELIAKAESMPNAPSFNSPTMGKYGDDESGTSPGANVAERFLAMGQQQDQRLQFAKNSVTAAKAAQAAVPANKPMMPRSIPTPYGTGSVTFNQPKRTGPTVFDGGKPVDMAASRQAGTIVTTPTAPNKPMLPVTKPAPAMATTLAKSSATVQSPVATTAAKPVVAAAPPNKPAPPTFVTMSPDQRQAYLQQQINAPAPTGPSVLQRAKANQTYPDVNAIRQARADQEAAKPLISKAAGAVASAASLAGQGLSQLSQVGTGMVGTAVGIGKDLAKATFVGDPDKAKKAAATLQAANKPMLPSMVRR